MQKGKIRMVSFLFVNLILSSCNFFIERGEFMAKKNIAIVTGASSGLGREFVKLLSRKIELDEIWVIARRKNKLDKLAKRYGKKIKVFPMDLSITENIKGFGENEELKRCNIKYLINNAGFAKFCSYNDISIDESINMIDLNISGIVAMGLVCIPHMSKGSHIINIASQAAFQPLPYQNIYSSTKAFIRNYTRALNVELKETWITATAVCPGWMNTRLYDRAIIGAKKATNHFINIVNPYVVARKALYDAAKGKDMSVYGYYVKMCHLIAKILPQKQMMKVWVKQQKLS